MNELLACFNQLDPQGREQLPRLQQLLWALTHQTTAKPDVPQGTVSTIATALLGSQADAAVVVTALRCLQRAVVLLSTSAPAVLRMEGGLKAILLTLQLPGLCRDAASLCSNLLAELCRASGVTLSAVIDTDALASLLHVLQLHGSDEALAAAVLDVLQMASKSHKGAVKLCELHLVPAIKEALDAHAASARVCGASLRCLRRAAKHTCCTGALLAAGACQVLLDAASLLSDIPGQQKQVKRACRALWLLCPSMLPDLPPAEACVPLPSRMSTPHLASALDSDVLRLQQLFPELQAVFCSSHAKVQPASDAVGATAGCTADSDRPEAAGPGAAGCSSASNVCAVGAAKLAKLDCRLVQMPPSVSELLSAAAGQQVQSCRSVQQDGQTIDSLAACSACAGTERDSAGVTAEPFHAGSEHLVVRNMLHDLKRIQDSGSILNRLAYDSAWPCPTELRHSPNVSPAPCTSIDRQQQQQQQQIAAVPASVPELCSFPAASRPTEDSTCRSESSGCNCSRITSRSDSKGIGLLEVPDSMDDGCCCSSTSVGSGLLPTDITSLNTTTAAAAAAASEATAAAAVGQLKFDSHFECGNLRAAVHVRGHEYDLFLANDINDRSSSSSTQWFYFAVWNAAPGATYKLNLVNFVKAESLFSTGKRPLICRGQPVQTPPPAEGGRQAPAAHQTADGAELHAAPATATPNSSNVAGCCGGPGQCRAGQHAPDCPAGLSCHGDGWHRVGHNICYYPSPYRARPAAGQGAGSPEKANRNAAYSTSTSSSGSSTAAVNGRISPSKRHNKTKCRKPHASQARHSKATGANMNSHGIADPVPAAVAAAAATTAASSKPAAAAAAGPDAAAGVPLGPGLHCCTFELSFPCSGLYFIASCYPFSYSELQQHLTAMQLQLEQRLPGVQPPCVRSLLCYTLSGLRCDLLTITDFNCTAAELASREYVVLTARVHPGETCASFVVQGIIDFLISDDPRAQRLRSCFVFKVVPMLNPDGVVVGNYRCSLAGVDLNRCWDKAQRELHPTIYHARQVMAALVWQAGRLALTIDLHGHSRKNDAFFYGVEPMLQKLTAAEARAASLNAPAATNICPAVEPVPAVTAVPGFSACVEGKGCCCTTANGTNKSSNAGSSHGAVNFSSTSTDLNDCCSGPSSSSGSFKQQSAGMEAALPALAAAAMPPAPLPSAAAIERLRVRMLPFLAAGAFHAYQLNKWSFKTLKGKASTARVVAARQLGVPGSYTLEASLAGSSVTQAHFSVRDYLEIGRSLMVAVAELAEADDRQLLQHMAASITMTALAGHAGSGLPAQLPH